ncbi:MAG: NAD-dependent epimerase/dehydratase family protein [Candidatus Thorarchaeota archaeon]
MIIAITGASGNLGNNVLQLLVKSDNQIRCLFTGSSRSLNTINKYRRYIKVVRGDIRDYKCVFNFLEGVDIVLHLAAIVPPRFNRERLNYSREVNVEGTKNIIKAIEEHKQKTKLIFPSSVAVWGDVRKRGACILTEDDPTNPNADDLYAQQKILSEEYIRKSKITWSIFRFGFMPNVSSLKFDPMMFDVPLDTNMEIVHVKDAAKAVVNGMNNEKIWGKIILIAGGESCRITYKQFVTTMLDTMGIGMLPEEAFGNYDFHCGWMDTSESQNLLQYQNYSFDSLIKELKSKTKLLRFFAKLFRPIAKQFLLGKSKYYKDWKKGKKNK